MFQFWKGISAVPALKYFTWFIGAGGLYDWDSRHDNRDIVTFAEQHQGFYSPPVFLPLICIHYTYVYTCMCICVYVYMCICIYVYMYIYAYVYMCICVYVYEQYRALLVHIVIITSRYRCCTFRQTATSRSCKRQKTWLQWHSTWRALQTCRDNRHDYNDSHVCRATSRSCKRQTDMTIVTQSPL